MSKSRLSRSLVPMVAVAALLSGCGGGITDATTAPGVAVRVGDDVISQSTINTAADAICALEEPRLVEAGQVVSMKRVKQLAVSMLAQRAQVMQIAQEYDVEPGPEVAAQRIELEKEAADLSADERAALVEAIGAEALFQSVLRQVGAIALAQDGVKKPTQEQVEARASDIYQNWSKSHAIEIDPRYSFAVSNGAPAPLDTGASVPVSDVAKDGWLQMADPAAADPETPASLPDSQRCG